MDGEPKTDADHKLDLYLESLIRKEGGTLATLADQECQSRGLDKLKRGDLEEHLGVIFTSPNLAQSRAKWESQLANELTKETALKEIVNLVINDIEATHNPSI